MGTCPSPVPFLTTDSRVLSCLESAPEMCLQGNYPQAPPLWKSPGTMSRLFGGGIGNVLGRAGNLSKAGSEGLCSLLFPSILQQQLE